MYLMPLDGFDKISGGFLKILWFKNNSIFDHDHFCLMVWIHLDFYSVCSIEYSSHRIATGWAFFLFFLFMSFLPPLFFTGFFFILTFFPFFIFMSILPTSQTDPRGSGRIRIDTDGPGRTQIKLFYSLSEYLMERYCLEVLYYQLAALRTEFIRPS